MGQHKILLIEPDRNAAGQVIAWFDANQWEVQHAVTQAEAVELLRSKAGKSLELVISEVDLAEGSAFELIRALRVGHPRLPVIMVAAETTAEAAIEATKQGAYDYLPKPLEKDELLASADRALNSSRLMARPVALEPGREVRDLIIGKSRAMQEVYKELGRVAAKPIPVLIRGETGTGKELIARAIYQFGHRAHLPFIAVNCAAIPETLLESELFGHERGAFTGADSRRVGRFEQAHNGTIFLDEIGELSPGTQAKLLRVLQERSIQRLGGREDIAVDVRVIAATNLDLERAMEERQFRPDLYFRLNVVTLNLPPLRERRDDISALVMHFLAVCNEAYQVDVQIEEKALRILEQQSWPGNVRQLENLIRQAVVTAPGDVLTASDLEDLLVNQPQTEARSGGLEKRMIRLLDEAARGKATDIYSTLLSEFEQRLLGQAIDLAGGNQSKAARWLGITRLTLREKLQQHGLHPRRKD
ncbi:MAG: sigma-54-dependent transcriptional regulator [Verrucomicrobiales bacterium]